MLWWLLGASEEVFVKSWWFTYVVQPTRATTINLNGVPPTLDTCQQELKHQALSGLWIFDVVLCDTTFIPS